jgi:hypothetical protein
MDEKYIVGVFMDEEPLVEAAKKMKTAGIKMEEIFTPYPIHEILEIQEETTRLTVAAYIYGWLAAIFALAFLYFTAVINWPLDFGGKPTQAFPSFILVTIVFTILSITILSLFSFSWRANLWPGKNVKPVHHEATDDKFIILINQKEGDFQEIERLLKEAGAVEVYKKDNL